MYIRILPTNCKILNERLRDSQHDFKVWDAFSQLALKPNKPSLMVSSVVNDSSAVNGFSVASSETKNNNNNNDNNKCLSKSLNRSSWIFN